MKRHHESHLDHGLNENQVAYIFELFADQREFFKTTIELPPELGMVPCALWGPAMGDGPIENDQPFELPPGEYIVPSGMVALADIQMVAALDGAPRPRFSLLPPFNGEITHAHRGARTWASRLINAPMRPTRKVFVVGGPHEEHACILYTAYGGPEAPQEPTDPKLTPASPKWEAAVAFWNVHALSRYGS